MGGVFRVLAVVSAVALAAPGAALARGDGEVAGRLFRLGGPGLEVDTGGPMRVAPDGSLVFFGARGGLWRLAPGAVRAQVVSSGSYFDVAVLRSGDLVAVDSSEPVVWRLAGRKRTIAAGGRGGPAPAGDGGPATAASLCEPSAIAALPDGGFAFVDGKGSRVRAVGADGTIRTVFTTTRSGDCGTTGGPVSGDIWALDSAPDGTLFIGVKDDLAVGDGSHLLRLSPSGALADLGAVAKNASAITVTADGSLLLAYGGVARRSPDGVITNVLRSGGELDIDSGEEFFGYWGDPRARFAGEATFAAADADGGLVGIDEDGLADFTGHLFYLAPAAPARAAVALALARGRASTTGYVAAVRVTRAGTLGIAITPRRGAVVRARAHVTPGLNRVRVPRVRAAGKATIRATLTADDGRRGVDEGRAYLGGLLRLADAKPLLEPDSCIGPIGTCTEETVRLERCGHIGPRRVDCRYRVGGDCEVDTAQLGDDGFIRTGTYACPRHRMFRKRASVHRRPVAPTQPGAFDARARLRAAPASPG